MNPNAIITTTFNIQGWVEEPNPTLPSFVGFHLIPPNKRWQELRLRVVQMVCVDIA